MAVQTNNPNVAYKSGQALTPYQLVVLNASLQVVPCSGAPTEVPIGWVQDGPTAANLTCSVRMTKAGTSKALAGAAIAQGQRIYSGAAGSVVPNQGGPFMGWAIDAASGSGSIIQVLPADAMFTTLLQSAIASSAVITNTTAETTFSTGSYIAAANSLQVGDVITLDALGIAPGKNSTDTLTIKLKQGTTVLWSSGAVAFAANDTFHIELIATVQAIGAGTAGKLMIYGRAVFGTPGTATVKEFYYGQLTLDTTLAQTLSVTATFSAASAGDQVQLDQFAVRKSAA